MMKNLLFLLFSFLLLISCSNRDAFELRNGDLLFMVDQSGSELVKAIQQSTSANKEIPFSHVGIVKAEKEELYVLEAASPEGVVKTPLNEFIEKAALLQSKPMVAVGRLKPEYRYTIAQATDNAENLLGRPYDYAYDENNNAFYCSELIRFAFLDSAQQPVFASLAMSFGNKETGEISLYWTEHFGKLNIPVPEGKPGTNPADMAKSPIIDIVHSYY